MLVCRRRIGQMAQNTWVVHYVVMGETEIMKVQSRNSPERVGIRFCIEESKEFTLGASPLHLDGRQGEASFK